MALQPIEIADSDGDSSCTNFDAPEIAMQKVQAAPVGPAVFEDTSRSSVPVATKRRRMAPRTERDKAFEVFCGSGGYTCALEKAGFDVVGIDFAGNKDKPKGRCLWIDLSRPIGQKQLLKLLLQPDVAYVHFAPPCGTASRARDRRRKNPDGSPAAVDPKPLRSDEFPDGLPGLDKLDLHRVTLANELYRFVAETVEKLSAMGIEWTVENPTRSYMWDTSYFRLLSRRKANGLVHYERVSFDMCMHGGERPKDTTFLTSVGLNLDAMKLKCDGGHEHKPWGLTHEKGLVFATAMERCYPNLLCRRLATAVAKQMGVSRTAAKAQSDRVAANLQPKKRFPPIVAEFKDILVFDEVDKGALEQLKTWLASPAKTHLHWLGSALPVGSKLLNEVRVREDSGLSRITIGLGWSTKEFLEASMQVTHPYDLPTRPEPEVAEALWYMATKGPVGTAAKRKFEILKYTKLKDDLAAKEVKLHKSLHPEVEKVVSSKVILLFKRMLEDIDYDDVAVHELLLTGVPLIGTVPKLPFWQLDHEKLPRTTPEMLWANARQAQASVSRQACPVDSEVTQKLWDLTLEETQEGGLEGPFGADDISAQLGALWVPARRFAVVQNSKIRPIDDFSEHGVNAAFGSGMRANMKSLDTVAAVAKAHLEAVGEDRRFWLRDSLGNEWLGDLHADWTLEQWRSLRGRVADLKSAYKQLASHPAHRAASVVAVQRPGGGVAFFKAYSLMFGTTAAVYAFLRFSRAISFLATKLLRIPVTEFFDDFTQVESQRLCSSSLEALEGLLTLLGWRISTSQDKHKPFEQCFVSLGVEVDFTRSELGEILLRNKPGRVAAIRELYEKLCAPGGKLGFKEALSLRGKISFAEGQTHARLTAPLARLLACWSTIRIPRPPSEELLLALSAAVQHLEDAGPRLITPVSTRAPLLVFVDGACEEHASIGAVLVDPEGENQYFGAQVSEDTVASWRSKLEQKQVIGQAELYPLLIARLTWQSRLSGRRVIYFIDNESARIVAIKAYSPVLASLRIIVECISFDYDHGITSWYARVPTCCNIADGPSRFSVSEVSALTQAARVSPVFPVGTVPAKVC